MPGADPAAAQMEVNCLTLQDLIGPWQSRLDFQAEDGESAQKENIYVERTRTVPKTPMKSEPIDLSKQRNCTPERNPITPVKLVDRSQAEPWTPTANLKMLISAASPDMRDREKKKELFRPIENKNAAFSESQQLDIEGDGTADEFEKQRPSRKQKSLGLLCQKFLARYPSYPLSTEKTTISLDEVATSLGVERRRIYDIVNVLESLHLVSRVAKNQYGWHGRHSLRRTLKGLRRLGKEQKYEEQMALLQQKELVLVDYKFGEQKKEVFADAQDSTLLEFSDAYCSSCSANSRKDKSLRIMSQKFVMLFLVSKTKIVTLDVAAKILIEESQDAADHSKFKTKVRRLYDIANVLTSLTLIKKVHVTEERGRKPAFKWIGPVDLGTDDDDQLLDLPTSALPKLKSELCPQDLTCAKQRLARHSSFNAVQASEGIKRKASSEPSSPHREEKRGSEEFCSKIANFSAACRQKIKQCPESESSVTEKLTPRNMDPIPLFPILPLDSELCLNSLPHQVFSVAQSDLPQVSLSNSLNGHIAVLPSSAASGLETAKPALLNNQPFVYVPSASLFMLYGSLPESLSPLTAGAERGGRYSDPETEATDPPPTSPTSPPIRSCRACVSLEANEPATKRQTDELEDGPLSLVLPKKPPPKKLGSTYSVPLENACLGLESSPTDEISEKAAVTYSDIHEPGNPSRSIEDHGNSTEEQGNLHLKNPSLPQYLFVQSAVGLNGLNFLLSTNQTPATVGPSMSQLTSLNVPCMVVPSTALAPFPVIYSPAITSALPSAGGLPNPGSLNFGMPGLAPTAHVLIGNTAVVNPKAAQLPPAEPQPRAQSPVHLSPVLTRSRNPVKPDSPICLGQPVTIVKFPQSPAPLTPESVRPRQHEAFFKTPGSLGSPATAWRKTEGSQIRNTSSAQRRLEISSGATD
ncbi:transcription factor E2F7 [Tachyglossus aculeatus]|uniref:transcription factor E2F7 n=1 Tax=Tachyglossus aculeatus TaxID=9261 RepID=UPI0018F4CB1F|nr:transcription factor E2F7 [Tachyglossus aculeatus]XP_038612524.1 transcription factor E2F7 [Tachyglossus aculeatus]